jgi:two-component SAPR family response regulator
MIKAVVVDDEGPSAQILKRLLEENAVEVSACFDMAKDALEYIENNDVDVAFLDIEMPGMNGLEMANHIGGKIGRGRECEVVFVTAFNEYAVDAFRVHALDYLLKPVSKPRLEETLSRISARTLPMVSKGRIEIRCFGTFEIVVNGEKIKFRTKKSEELLAFLIDKRGVGVSRNEIIDRLWGDFEGDKALINLNTTLYYTRKALGRRGIDIPILYENSGYRIGKDCNFSCDYYSFIECGLPGEIHAEEGLEYFEEIAQLYRGHYLDVNDYNWAEGTRLNLKEKYIHLVLSISDYYRKGGRNFKAMEILKKGFNMDPLNGRITYNLMHLMLTEGYYSLAAGYYNTHRAEFLKMFSREPDENLSKLLL